MEQPDLLRESWNCKYRIDGLKKEMSDKNKKHKEEIEQLRAAISAAKIQMGIISTRFYNEERAKKEALKKKNKVISKAKLQQPTDDVCSVCFENHNMCDVIQTSCNHQIGKECYQMWVNQCNSLPVRNGRKTIITCPVCRRVNPQVFEFRQRKTKNNV